MRAANWREQRMRSFVFAGYQSTLQVKSFISIRIRGKPIAVFKRRDGTFLAMEMACTHDGANLTRGVIRTGVVTCPLYGRQFALETGECLNWNSPPLKRHAVRLMDDAVYVSRDSLPAMANHRRSAIDGEEEGDRP